MTWIDYVYSVYWSAESKCWVGYCAGFPFFRALGHAPGEALYGIMDQVYAELKGNDNDKPTI